MTERAFGNADEANCYGCGETFELESWDFCEPCSHHRMICATCCGCVQVTIRSGHVSEFLCDVAHEIVKAQMEGRTWESEEEHGSCYTDEAQDLFDEWSASLRDALILYFDPDQTEAFA